MNSPQIAAPDTAAAQDGDEINLLELLDVVLDSRWLIAAATAVALLVGGTYAFLSTPIFEANTLIQVEEGKGAGGAGSALGEASSLFEIRSPASAEIEILRSRLVVGQVVQNLQLDLTVLPKTIPVIGNWMSRRATAPSAPGFLGMPGYVNGNESLKVATFEVPPALEGQRFSVVITDKGYDLLSQDGVLLSSGTVGALLAFTSGGEKGQLLVAAWVGKPGAEFYLAKRSRLGVVQSLQNSLSIAEVGRQAGMIRTSLTGSDPTRITLILNEIATLYVRQNTNRKGAEAEKSLGFLDTLLPQLRRQIEESETKFNQFRNRNNTFDLPAEAKVVLDQSVKQQTSLFELQQRRKELEARFTAQHPSIQTIDAQIKAVSGEIGALSSRVKALPDVEQDLLRLTRDLKVSTELYASLLNSSLQLRLVKEGKVGNVRVVDVAAVPEQSVKPQRSKILAIAGGLGLLAGLALAFLRNSMRPGINDPQEIEQRAGLNVFSTIPFSPAQLLLAKNIKSKASGNHLLALSQPDDPAVESLRSLRTALQFALLDITNNIVLITGPTPGIGKSFTSANFAAVLGAAGKRVLLIDADLRKGHLNQYFGIGRGKGLSEVITGSAPLEDALHRQAAPNVDFLSTGTLPPNPAELLMTAATRQLLSNVGAQYDLVIIDSAPVLAASDTAVLAPLVGATFLVARAEITSVGELIETVKRLAQSGARANGVIFNGLNTTKRRYGYGAGQAGRYRYRYTNYQY